MREGGGSGSGVLSIYLNAFHSICVCVRFLELEKVSFKCFDVFHLTAIHSLEVMRWNPVQIGRAHV